MLLIVSIGGSAGLFVGASMLSFVELFYFFTIRAIWNAKVRKRLENDQYTLKEGVEDTTPKMDDETPFGTNTYIN